MSTNNTCLCNPEVIQRLEVDSNSTFTNGIKSVLGLSLIFLGALFMRMRLPVSAARVVRAMRRHRFERELEAAQRGAAPKQGAGGALDGLSKRELSLATEGSGHIKAAQAQADAEAEVERGLALPSAA